MRMFKTATAMTLAIGVCGMVGTALAAANAGKASTEKAWQQANAVCGAEITATAEGDARERFRRLDTDSSGKLSKQEFLDCYTQQMEQQAQAGGLSREQLEQAWKPEIQRELQAFDANQDQQITEQEFVAASQRAGGQQQGSAQQTGQAGKAGQQTGQTGQTGQQADATGRTNVQVQQPPAQVKVDQAPADVTVKQKPADVTVQQGQPDVTVETKPPQVVVEQPKPKVTVEQAEPKVTVEQGKPNVTVERAEPNVTVKQGKPEVTVKQAERADVEMRTPEREQAQGQQAQAQQDRGQQAEQRTDQDRERADTAGQAATTADAGEQGIRDDVAYVETRADDFLNRDVVNLAGEEVGEIEELVVNPANDRVHALIEVGGFLGMGGKEVAIPLRDLRLGENNVILMTRQTEDSLKDMQAFDNPDWRRIGR